MKLGDFYHVYKNLQTNLGELMIERALKHYQDGRWDQVSRAHNFHSQNQIILQTRLTKTKSKLIAPGL